MSLSKNLRVSRVAIIGAVSLLAGAAFGHARFSLSDADPESSVPSAEARDGSPLEFGYFLQDILDRAQTATRTRQFDAAIRYYRAVAKAVPDRALGFSRLCQVHELKGQRAEALAACRTALGLPGVVVDDHVRFVRLILAAPEALPATDIADVKASVEHLRLQPDATTIGNDLQCQVGMRLHDAAMLGTCTAALAATAPLDAKTLSYQWALALLNGDRAEASRVAARAQAAGLPTSAVQLMQERSAEPLLRWPTRLADWRFSLALAVAILAGTAAILTIARRRRDGGQQQHRTA